MGGKQERKRAVAFVDGQNLYFAAREAFGYTYPNYDVKALAQALCTPKGWELTEVHFYTGVPDEADNKRWNRFWAHKLAAMGRRGGISSPARFATATSESAFRMDRNSPSCRGRRKGLTSAWRST